MKSKSLGYVVGAVVVALLVALLLGVPLGVLAIFGFVLICPMGMFWMMRGMGGWAATPRGPRTTRSTPTTGAGPTR